MGWGRTLLLGDVGNRLDIEDVERDVARLKHKLADSHHLDMSQDERLAHVETRNAELTLYLSATLRLLLSKGMVDQSELAKIVDAIDASDGECDGGYDGPIV